MKRFAAILIIALLCSAGAYAQEYIPDRWGMSTDARATAMGGTMLASEGTAYATFGNAASPLFSHKLAQLSYSYTLFTQSGYKDERLMGVGATARFAERHAISFGMKLYSETKHIAGRLPGAESYDLGYACKVSDNVALAATFRYLNYRTIRPTKLHSFDLDLALLAHIPVQLFERSSVNIGGKISNIGIYRNNKSYVPSMNLAVGTALNMQVYDAHSVELALDMGYCIIPKPMREFYAQIGAEYSLMQMLKFRCGGYVSQHLRYGTVGVGIRFFHLQFDFAYMIAGKGNPLHNCMQFCAGLDF